MNPNPAKIQSRIADLRAALRWNRFLRRLLDQDVDKVVLTKGPVDESTFQGAVHLRPRPQKPRKLVRLVRPAVQQDPPGEQLEGPPDVGNNPDDRDNQSGGVLSMSPSLEHAVGYELGHGFLPWLVGDLVDAAIEKYAEVRERARLRSQVREPVPAAIPPAAPPPSPPVTPAPVPRNLDPLSDAIVDARGRLILPPEEAGNS